MSIKKGGAGKESFLISNSGKGAGCDVPAIDYFSQKLENNE
jgi:hypothetical protein